MSDVTVYGSGVALIILPTWGFFISKHGTHGLTSLLEDGPCEQCLFLQHCWRTWLKIESATLISAGQYAMNQATEAGRKFFSFKNFICATEKLLGVPLSCKWYTLINPSLEEDYLHGRFLSNYEHVQIFPWEIFESNNLENKLSSFLKWWIFSKCRKKSGQHLWDIFHTLFSNIENLLM